MEVIDEAYAYVQKKITERLTGMRDVSDEELYEVIEEEIENAENVYFLPVSKKTAIRSGLYDSFRRLDLLQELLDDRNVTEIMINGPADIFIEKNGKMQKWDRHFKSREQLEDIIQQIVSKVNRTVNVSSPICDARLIDGSRVNVVLPPISLEGPTVTVRKFPEPLTAEKLVEFKAVSREAMAFLKRLVAAGYNIFISGGTNSGKTTFLNALSSFIPSRQRVITIEDSAELQIRHIDNLVRFETRAANSQGEGAISISDLIRASLRANPDRIIVGEVRGAEALDMLQAMNTGHDGSLSTGHGNSPGDMLARLETMVMEGADLPLAAIRGQIAAAFDIMVHLGRLRDRSRRVLSIVEVGNYEEGEIRLNTLYEFREDSEFERGKKRDKEEKVRGSLVKVGKLKNTRKLLAAGDGLQDI